MKSIFAKFNFENVLTTFCLANAVVSLAWIAPRLFKIVAVVYAVVALVKLVKWLTRKISKTVSGTNWKSLQVNRSESLNHHIPLLAKSQ
jgi:hypothetical protein